jgi:hypothetical protein
VSLVRICAKVAVGVPLVLAGAVRDEIVWHRKVKRHAAEQEAGMAAWFATILEDIDRFGKPGPGTWTDESGERWEGRP